ncbi:MAG: hypothetical protein CL946_06900 [Ectothiorhodospiraceae bacterium]|nr:hypothetical protein [Ectothiorhodospiraceae bacterium]
MYVIGIVTLLLVPSQIGLPQLVLRETVRAIEADENIATASIIRWSYIAVTLAGLVAIGGLLVFSQTKNAADIAHLILIGLPLILLSSWNALRASVLRAYGWVTRSQIPENVVKPTALLIFIGIVAWAAGGKGVTAGQAIAANVVAVALAFVVGFFLFRMAHKRRNLAHRYQHSLWLWATLALGLTTSLRAISTNLDIVLLGSFGMVEEAGVFKVAALIGAQVGVALQIANIVVAKDVGAALERGQTKEVERILRKSSLLTAAASAALVLFLLAFGRVILDIAFPPAFKEAYWPMIILALAQLVNCFTGSVGLLLNFARKEWSITGALAISTAANVVLNLVLIPQYGALGAAYSSLSSMIIWNAILFRTVSRDLSMNIGIWAGIKDAFQRRSLW